MNFRSRLDLPHWQDLDNGIDCGVFKLVAAFIRLGAAVTGAATSSHGVLIFIPFDACGVAALRHHHPYLELRVAMLRHT